MRSKMKVLHQNEQVQGLLQSQQRAVDRAWEKVKQMQAEPPKRQTQESTTRKNDAESKK